jgi:FtsH-binding integral membrane protein
MSLNRGRGSIMSQYPDTFRPMDYTLADQATSDVRMAFLRRTYAHLLGAVLAFAGIEAAIFASGMAEPMTELMLASSQWSWLIVLGAFMVVSGIAQAWARSEAGRAMQYAGLALFVVAEAVIFAPLLFVASLYGGAEIIPTAGIITVVTFTGLTAVVFLTRSDFSFLGPFLGMAGFVALGVIVCAIVFNFNLGMIFTIAMIAFACGYILYHTSNILHTYRTDQHVAAALALFASVALLFWYVLRLLMVLRR